MQPKQHPRGRMRLGAAIAIAAAGAALAIPTLATGAGGLVSKMNGNKVVPEGTGAPNGRGKATFKLRIKQRKLCYEVTFRNTGGAVRGYVFRGKRGQEPPNPNRPVVTLFATPQTSPAAGCATSVAKKKLKRLKNKPKRFHVVLVNGAYENGAVRGQIKKR